MFTFFINCVRYDGKYMFHRLADAIEDSARSHGQSHKEPVGIGLLERVSWLKSFNNLKRVKVHRTVEEKSELSMQQFSHNLGTYLDCFSSSLSSISSDSCSSDSSSVSCSCSSFSASSAGSISSEVASSRSCSMASDSRLVSFSLSLSLFLDAMYDSFYSFVFMSKQCARPFVSDYESSRLKQFAEVLVRSEAQAIRDSVALPSDILSA